MIEKLKVVIKPEDWELPVNELEMRCLKNLLLKVDELVDAVNKLETMARNTNTVLKSLVEENNIHEKQIDKLQMKLEPHKCEPAENGKGSKMEQVADETLKCPFCQQEYVIHKDDSCFGQQRCVCRNPNCEFDGWHFPVKLVSELIRTRKALDLAKEGLKEIQDKGEYVNPIELAESYLDEIEALEQKEE